LNWDDLTINSVAVHYVPTARDDEPGSLVLTDEAIPLDADLREYFRDKIAERLRDKGLAVVVDDIVESPIPSGVTELASTPDALVSISRAFATHLDTIQSGINSSGLLAVGTASVGNQPFVAVLKLERERGIRFAINEVDGRQVVDMELLRNLTLTDKTKVYKTALLGVPADGQDVEGYVADDQRGRTDGSAVATFFLSRFLGCKPKVPAAQQTFEFVKAANSIFNEHVESAEIRGRYQVALLAKLQDNTADIRPSSFATANLAPNHTESFLNGMDQAGIPRNETFAKDTSLINASRFRMVFESGMVLVGDNEALRDKVIIPDNPGPDHPVKLGDSVDKLLAGR
jgi:hypothetical protein